MFQQSFVVLVLTVLVPFCTCRTQPDPSVTCQPENPFAPSPAGDNVPFKICLFNKTDNVVTNTIGVAANLGFYTHSRLAFLAGKCYCKQDCKLSQIVCENPDLFYAMLPPRLNINIANGVAEIAYLAELWNGHCYCPSLVPEGADPCARPAVPDFCKPYPGSF